MLPFRKSLVTLAALGALGLPACADQFSAIYFTLGPVPSLSPSYAGYTTNAQAGTLAGTNVGDINTSPTGFTQVSTVTNADITFDSNFNNWRGVANPAGAFSGEFGTVLFMSFVLTGTGNNIALNDITYNQSDNDGTNYFGFSGSFSGVNYSADKVGILANGTPVAPGTAGTTLVHQIIVTSIAVGFEADANDPPYTGTPAEQLAEAIADENTLGNSYTFSAGVADETDSVSMNGSLDVFATPEPAPVALFSLGIIGLWAFCRRFKSLSH